MIEHLSPESPPVEKSSTRVPDISSISVDQPEKKALATAKKLKEFLKAGGLTAKDATNQVNRLLERKGLKFKLPEQTEKLG